MGFAARSLDASLVTPDTSPPADESSRQSMIVKREAKPTARTADVLVDILVDAGVEVIFGLPGGPIAPIHDALLDRPEIRTITTRHEAGAVFAAAGYAQTTGKLAVAVVTSGPGILNALTGLASAHCDGLPVLLLCGEVPKDRFGKGACHEGSVYELDIVHMARSITKLAAQAHDPNLAPALMQRAIATALSGRRGAVLLSLPMDVMTAEMRRPMIDVSAHVEFDVDRKTLASVSHALDTAERGVLLVGSGARWGQGPRRVRELAERLQMPVMTTPKAKGVFPENHPLSLGVFGWGGHPSAHEYLGQGIDVLMAIGTSLGESATDNWSRLLSPTKEFIQLDVEAERIGRSYPVTIGLVDTVEQALPKIMARLGTGVREKKSFGVRRHEPGDLLLAGDEGRISPQRALWELQQVLPQGTRYTSDIGAHMFFALHHLEIVEPRGFMTMLGLASMGSGIGSAVGVKVAEPHLPVVSICGDGCFSMGLGDVATAAMEGIPMIVAVMNDERYGMVEIGNNVVYGRSPAFPSGPMSVPRLAEGIGARFAEVDKPGQILEMDLLSLAEHRPLVLDIKIDRSVHLNKARLEFLKEMATAKKRTLS
ncbi:MAG: thiamine pyrophosphate-binding protein [Labilithrix sp.]|nr:thiamine pyrophosphate-binding protein [Labilithrix sp.]